MKFSPVNGEPSGDFRFGMSRGFGDLAVAPPIRCLRTEFPKLKLHAFVQWSAVLLERLNNRSLDAALVMLPEGTTPPSSFVSELLAKRAVHVVAAKNARLGQQPTLEEVSAEQWVLNPHGCGTRHLLEAALLQRGLPFASAVEAEGYELQFSLICDGIGLGLAMPEVLQASAFRKQLKVVKVQDFFPMQGIWLIQSRHIGRMAPVVLCLRETMLQMLKEQSV